jgi:hypothetical protein
MLKIFQVVYYSFLFYGGVLLLPISPGTLAWKLFKNKKGKIPLIHRDLICDSETLMALPKSENSLDEFTTAFSPFIPLLTLNGEHWKLRRKILSDGLRKINIDQDFKFTLPLKKGDIYWDVFENLFQIGFQLIFGRPCLTSEFDDMYPGIEDINRLIKRQVGFPNKDLRWKLYHRVVRLLSADNSKFIFKDSDEFNALNEVDRVSIVVEDLLTSICIQCSDLICHMLLLYASYEEHFKTNLDNCINETLRLYPLTDIWTRKSVGKEKAWIASLIQLNRNGWDDPDCFKPERWNLKDHLPLISWGFDTRSCPASNIGYNLSKKIFQKILNENIWVQPASNYNHDRTFTPGCQVWIGEGKKPALLWKYKGKWKSLFKQWLFNRLRVLDQWELW